MPDRPLARFLAAGCSRRVLLAGIAAPALAARWPAGVVSAQADGATLTIVIQSGFSDLDPQSAYDNLCSMFFMATYDLLLRLKESSTDEFEPMLARSWETGDDGAVTFALAPDAVFHDGSPCDAAAVKASFSRFLEQGMGPVNVISRFVDSPDRIVVVDPATVRFELGRPQPLFLAAMASEYGPFVVNTRQTEANRTDDDPFANQWLQINTAGGGPYQVVEYEPSASVVLERFPDYHLGWEGGEFERIVIRVVPENATRRQLVENGDADALTFSLTPDDVDAMRPNPDLQVLTYDTSAVNWVFMNAPRLQTADARKGFSYAFPYDTVADSAYRGLLTRTSGPIASSIRGYDPDGFRYATDLAKAKELILAAGFAEGDRFEYLVASEYPVEVLISQLFQANVEQMGFGLDISQVDGATFNTLAYGDAPAEERPHFFGGWGWWPDYNDPWNQLAPNFLEAAIGGGGANAGQWVNERFEAIMAEAKDYKDEARLVELMKEAQNILTEQDPPGIYYGQLQWYTILRTGITGYQNNPLYLGSYPFRQLRREGE